jgi:hypothetical protein
MLDYQALRDQLIPIHGIVGLFAIAIGIVALSVPKRAPLHPWAGRSFMVSMSLAIAIAAPVIVAGNNLFLIGVGLLVGYHILVAWRLARLKPPMRRPALADRWLHPVFALVFLIFAGYGVTKLIAGSMMGLVVVVLSGVGLSAVLHFFRFMNRADFEQDAWIGEHIRGVAAAFIASITAFAAATGPRLAPGIPEPLLWLGPTLVFTPLFIRLAWLVQRERAAKQAEADPDRSIP